MLNRIALRFAAVEALCPQAMAATGPWPTIAGNRVFDSRQDPVDLLDADEQRPIVMVYTEEHEGTAFGRASRFGFDEQVVSLVFELMIATRGQMPVKRPDGTEEIIGTVDVPVSDWRHEMLLDMLEALVVRAMTSNSPASEAFRKVAVEIRQMASVPLRSEEKTVRLAARTLTLQVQVRADEWPLDPAASGTGLLPSPLFDLLPYFPVGTLAGDAIRDLARYTPPPLGFTTIPEIGLFGNIGNDTDPTEENAEFSGRMQTQGTSQ